MAKAAYSYAAANIFPLKLLINRELVLAAGEGTIPAVHYQLNPTNRCNFNCSFCSCGGRDQALELSLSRIKELFVLASRWGIQSCTITGGGEPTMHRSFSKMLDLLEVYKIDTGLVTNGTLLKGSGSLSVCTWIRVSLSDVLGAQVKGAGFRDTQHFLTMLEEVIDDNPKVDWAISYVLGPDPDFKLIAESVKLTNEHHLTHIRLVNDILKADSLSWTLEAVSTYLQEKGVDDGRVNYQDRSTWTQGQNPCYISLLKPVVGADGFIYPCCGAQYALANPSRDYEMLMRMGGIEDLPRLIKGQHFFNGSTCLKCYYSQYNQALETLLQGIDHPSFV